MFTSVDLGIIGTVVAAVASIYSVLPGEGFNEPVPAPSDAPAAANVLASAHLAGGLFSNGIVSIVDELASFQTDPDYERAEARLAEMETIGNRLAKRLGELNADLEARFIELTGTAD